jgi:hypothetical protein
MLKLVDAVRGLPLAAAWYEARLTAVDADAGAEGVEVYPCDHHTLHDKQIAQCPLEGETGR